ncbi:MAG: serine acetyltransferase [Halobacteriota archaeon]
MKDWPCINSKESYRQYLEADERAYNIKDLTRIAQLTDPVWKFQRLLRKVEYVSNCKHSVFYRPYNLWLRHKLHKLSIKTGIIIPPNVFGPGLCIGHYGPLIVHRKAKIGANCNVQNCVHIGQKVGYAETAPRIGDNVYIGAGAQILGDVEIADGIVIGANAVVISSFQTPNITVAGVPAKKMSDKGTAVFWGDERRALKLTLPDELLSASGQ